MDFNWKIFATALGLAFIIEGLPYFLFAERMPNVLRMIAERPPSFLRGLGLMAMVVGLVIVLVVRS
ncbi:DUF2065 domain-containing protein [Oceanidesulfovibrio indonesiensis]|jgi:hypothetical protein|uniref:DUF2065 domain-containing protein n=1 Tax=Oceanidesulfovibrio indonesiensis TaxID=54767 RepID=A0A7M3MGH0_9BACT|nr:DUF2065 domain-containing protein [Oceanidesulfovibrio indonesiensis]TVM17989.1 DUF2065 domain-containing protein [Oceanidesulfovibrio indonesiensis]